MLSGGKHAVRKLKRAQILLAADAGVSDEAIASSVSVGGSTVYRTKRPTSFTSRRVIDCVQVTIDLCPIDQRRHLLQR